MESLKKMASPTARVLRDTLVECISATDVVIGDILVFEEGDVVPADARLIECFHLEVDEALLTGESVPVTKKSVIPVDLSYLFSYSFFCCNVNIDVGCNSFAMDSIFSCVFSVDDNNPQIDVPMDDI